MRLALLAILPVMLAACGGGSVDPDDRMPTPYPEGSDGEESSSSSPVAIEYAIGTTEASEIEGEWSSASIGGNDSQVFTSAAGDQIAAVSCQDTGADAPNGVLFHRFIGFDDAGEGISVYTSAGAKSYGVAGDNPVTITVGQNDPFAVMLAAARGDIRVVTGSGDIVVFPTSDEMRELISDCRGAYRPPVVEDTEDEDGEDTDEE
ncbi:MAG: hypothetical protein WA989_00120 [Henriciella sp.]|uniref:hypothetical protein n=1 Tax=Henriciella sp. TaxID=1968823 RepID=UPI003C747F32